MKLLSREMFREVGMRKFGAVLVALAGVLLMVLLPQSAKAESGPKQGRDAAYAILNQSTLETLCQLLLKIRQASCYSDFWWFVESDGDFQQLPPS
jgi:hypothetical protein